MSTELIKGKNATKLVNEGEVVDALAKMSEVAELVELDALMEKQARFC